MDLGGAKSSKLLVNYWTIPNLHSGDLASSTGCVVDPAHTTAYLDARLITHTANARHVRVIFRLR